MSDTAQSQRERERRVKGRTSFLVYGTCNTLVSTYVIYRLKQDLQFGHMDEHTRA